jgi:hypothetical protein
MPMTFVQVPLASHPYDFSLGNQFEDNEILRLPVFIYYCYCIVWAIIGIDMLLVNL